MANDPIRPIPGFGFDSMTFLAPPMRRPSRDRVAELDHRFPPDVPFRRGGEVLEFLTLIRAMRTPFPMFNLKPRVVESRMHGSRDDIFAFEVTLLIDVQIYDRDRPGQAMPLTFSGGQQIPIERATPRFLLRFVRDFISRTFMHELDENFFVGDARVFDPHDEQLVKQESDFGSFIP